MKDTVRFLQRVGVKFEWLSYYRDTMLPLPPDVDIVQLDPSDWDAVLAPSWAGVSPYAPEFPAVRFVGELFYTSPEYRDMLTSAYCDVQAEESAAAYTDDDWDTHA